MRIAIEELEDLTARAIRSYGYNEEDTSAIKDSLLYAPGERGGKSTKQNIDNGEIEVEDNLLKESRAVAKRL